jgi:hypothetical protein
MKKDEVELFEKVNSQIKSFYEEINGLSKKSPNDGVNRFKLKFMNEIISQANTLLDNNHKPFQDFESFSVDELPSNSDVAFILSQYLNCLENLRAKNISDSEFDVNWYWVVNGKVSSIITAPPKKIKER